MEIPWCLLTCLSFLSAKQVLGVQEIFTSVAQTTQPDESSNQIYEFSCELTVCLNTQPLPKTFQGNTSPIHKRENVLKFCIYSIAVSTKAWIGICKPQVLK